ncbi:hypothetical protein, partial [Nocardioides sp.]|uniref:hypothetical protein n=1 Tax=Nocardioides sp. TaxID=35761 RepID=UPI002733154A
EEQDAVAILQSVLTHAEWEVIDEKFKKGLGFGELLALVPWVLHELPPEVRGTLFGQPGGGVHRLMWLLTRRRFDRQDRAAFAHRPRT